MIWRPSPSPWTKAIAMSPARSAAASSPRDASVSPSAGFERAAGAPGWVTARDAGT